MRLPFGIFCLILFLLIIPCALLFSQEVPHPTKNTGIYEFLDELAGMQLIEINSAVKPYSRLFIANRLREADEKREQLNTRQQKELDFYLMDFGKEVMISGKDGRTARPHDRTTFFWYKGLEVQDSNGTIKHLRRDLFYYKDSLFSFTANMILGGELFTNSSGKATYFRNGAEIRGYIKNLGFYASLAR